MNKVKEIEYLKKHLETKADLTPDELRDYILYDLYLKHPSEVAPKVIQKVLSDNTASITPMNTGKELSDIFPKLRAYEAAKEAHFKGRGTESVVEPARAMLKEIIEFLRSVYQNADTQEERDLITKAYGIIGNIH